MRYTFPSFLSLFVLLFVNHWFLISNRDLTLKDIISRVVRQESESFTAQLVVLDYIAQQFAAVLSKVFTSPSSFVVPPRSACSV